MEEKTQLHQDIEKTTQENYQKLYGFFVKEEWDPHMLQTVTSEEIEEYTDFLMEVKKYYNKIKAWTAITKEEREKFGTYLEESWWTEKEKESWWTEKEIARFKNMKDIAYHKYLWMTRWKMPWYTYTMDKQPNILTEIMNKRIETIHPNQKFDNVYIYDIYSRNPVDYNMDFVKSTGGRNSYIKSTEGFNGLNLYLKQLNTRLEDAISKKRLWNQVKAAMQMLLELRYMYEVADATHNVSNRNMISSMIEKIEVAIQTVQNNDFEAEEAKKKAKMEEKALLEYCQKNSVTMEDIVMMQNNIEKIQKENELTNESLLKTTQSLEEIIKKQEAYEKILQEISEQAKKSLLGNDYKIPQEIIGKIRVVIKK